MWDLSSLTRVQTYTLCSGWAESQALDSWGSLRFSPIFNLPPSLPSFLSFSTQHELSMNYSDFTFTFPFMRWRRKWQPLQYSCLENPRDRGAWQAAIYGVAQSQTRLKRLSSSSSSSSIGQSLCWWLETHLCAVTDNISSRGCVGGGDWHWPDKARVHIREAN